MMSATTLTLPFNAQAVNIAEQVCNLIASDDKKRLRSFLKSNKVKIRNIFSGVQCNGLNILTFASSESSEQTGGLIISKLPRKVVAENIEHLKSGAPAILDMANQRIHS